MIKMIKHHMKVFVSFWDTYTRVVQLNLNLF